MAYVDTRTGIEPVSKAGGSWLDALVRLAESHPRLREMQRLSSMSDDELRERGIDRDRIHYHVMRGCFWL